LTQTGGKKGSREKRKEVRMEGCRVPGLALEGKGKGRKISPKTDRDNEDFFSRENGWKIVGWKEKGGSSPKKEARKYRRMRGTVESRKRRNVTACDQPSEVPEKKKKLSRGGKTCRARFHECKRFVASFSQNASVTISQTLRRLRKTNQEKTGNKI